MSNATLNFGVVGPTMDFTTSVTVSEANAARILAYLVGGTPYGTVTDGDDTRPATAEEAAQAFALGILQGLLDQTTRHEREAAANAAADAIAPIAPEG
jgi:hypothetical protein